MGLRAARRGSAHRLATRAERPRVVRGPRDRPRESESCWAVYAAPGGTGHVDDMSNQVGALPTGGRPKFRGMTREAAESPQRSALRPTQVATIGPRCSCCAPRDSRPIRTWRRARTIGPSGRRHCTRAPGALAAGLRAFRVSQDSWRRRRDACPRTKAGLSQTVANRIERGSFTPNGVTVPSWPLHRKLGSTDPPPNHRAVAARPSTAYSQRPGADSR